mgnify:CR=1 FL=1
MTYFNGECECCDNRFGTVIEEVENERKAQDKKWGQQNHSWPEFLMILGEEVGEANKAGTDAFLAVKSGSPGIAYNELTHMRTELIQVAAMAVQIVESLDRNELVVMKPTDS